MTCLAALCAGWGGGRGKGEGGRGKGEGGETGREKGEGKNMRG